MNFIAREIYIVKSEPLISNQTDQIKSTPPEELFCSLGDVVTKHKALQQLSAIHYKTSTNVSKIRLTPKILRSSF
jgi:hypothetical protein